MDTSPNSSSVSADQLLQAAADTFRERNAVYGDNFRNFPAVMMGLFPEGVMLRTYEDWMRMQFMMLDAVKSTRYAQNFHNGGHIDSAHDKIVYAAMQEATDHEFNQYRAAEAAKPEAHGDYRKP